RLANSPIGADDNGKRRVELRVMCLIERNTVQVDGIRRLANVHRPETDKHQAFVCQIAVTETLDRLSRPRPAVSVCSVRTSLVDGRVLGRVAGRLHPGSNTRSGFLLVRMRGKQSRNIHVATECRMLLCSPAGSVRT